MNKHKLTITAFAFITLLATACKKNDPKYQAPEQPTTKATAPSPWKSVNNWSDSKQNGFTVYNGKIEDGSITPEVISKGLVLVYKSKGGSVLTLPSEDSENNYWYYQISKGAVTITSDVYGADQTLDQNSTFQYFILTKDRLAKLEAKGYSKSKLMSLSHADASQLIAK